MEKVVKELTLLELRTKNMTLYKVTKRIPVLRISDTRLCATREEALLLLEEWSE